MAWPSRSDSFLVPKLSLEGEETGREERGGGSKRGLERVRGQVSPFPIPLRRQFGAIETRISSAKAARGR